MAVNVTGHRVCLCVGRKDSHLARIDAWMADEDWRPSAQWISNRVNAHSLLLSVLIRWSHIRRDVNLCEGGDCWGCRYRYAKWLMRTQWAPDKFQMLSTARFKGYSIDRIQQICYSNLFAIFTRNTDELASGRVVPLAMYGSWKAENVPEINPINSLNWMLFWPMWGVTANWRWLLACPARLEINGASVEAVFFSYQCAFKAESDHFLHVVVIVSKTGSLFGMTPRTPKVKFSRSMVHMRPFRARVNIFSPIFNRVYSLELWQCQDHLHWTVNTRANKLHTKRLFSIAYFKFDAICTETLNPRVHIANVHGKQMRTTIWMRGNRYLRAVPTIVKFQKYSTTICVRNAFDLVPTGKYIHTCAIGHGSPLNKIRIVVGPLMAASVEYFYVHEYGSMERWLFACTQIVAPSSGCMAGARQKIQFRVRTRLSFRLRQSIALRPLDNNRNFLRSHFLYLLYFVYVYKYNR